MSLWPEDEWEQVKGDGGETAGVGCPVCVCVTGESGEIEARGK